MQSVFGGFIKKSVIEYQEYYIASNHISMTSTKLLFVFSRKKAITLHHYPPKHAMNLQ